MPSDETKPSKKHAVKEEEEKDGDDYKSLNAMVGDKKGRPAASANAGPTMPVPKVKVEEGGKGDSGKKTPGKPAPSRVKKEETDDDDDDDDDKPIARRTAVVKTDKKMSVKKEVKEEDDKKVVKVEVKKRKTNATAAATAADAQNGKKREKKVYDLPGQKRDPPEERDPLRIFYETLYKQIPRSEMAQFWMMESGLLPREEAKKVFEKKQKSKFSSPAKSTGSARRTPQSDSAKKAVSSTVSTVKKTTEVKVSSKQSKKRKGGGGSSDDDSDNDFVLASRVTKRQKAS
ncbi:hypothetical protein MLD38_035008 [Melastoma candidum]|uniref:Uncharacterized protein n=1 Tax=Melastoma candidum TaxID=119954 RepID=A0ACB9MFH7_9MYRT|nr:hypothetical protein MLD38_035008 [Melastoma candidum]